MGGSWLDALLDSVTGGAVVPDFSAWAEGRFPFDALVPFGLLGDRETAFPGIGLAPAPGNPAEGTVPGLAERAQDDAAEAEEQLAGPEQARPEDLGWRSAEFPGVGPDQEPQGDQGPPQGKGWTRENFPADDSASTNARFLREPGWARGPSKDADADAADGEQETDSMSVAPETTFFLPDPAQAELPEQVFSGLDHFPFGDEPFPASSLPDAASAHGNSWGENRFPLGMPFGADPAFPPGLGNAPLA